MNLKTSPVSLVLHKSSAALMIQGIADAGIVDWQSVFERHITNAKKAGRMPDEFSVIKETLDDYSFVMQSTLVEGMSLQEGLDKLGQLRYPATVMIQTDCIFHSGGYMHTFKTDGYQYRFVNTGRTRPSEKYPGVIMHAWIRWDDGIDRSPYPRRKYKPKVKQPLEYTPDPETRFYLPFNPNPYSRSIGDCVVRAIAGVMDASWEEALDILASQGETTVNDEMVFKRVLRLLGFVHHDKMMLGKRSIKGWEFCEAMTRSYHHGERIFANVGGSHVAAIAPVRDSDGSTVYKILDSWDSSKKQIGEYWASPKNNST